MANTYTFKPETLRNFYVTQDAQPAWEYMDAVIAAERSQTLTQAAERAISFTMRTSLTLAKKAGHALIESVDTYIASGQ